MVRPAISLQLGIGLPCLSSPAAPAIQTMWPSFLPKHIDEPLILKLPWPGFPRSHKSPAEHDTTKPAGRAFKREIVTSSSLAEYAGFIKRPSRPRAAQNSNEDLGIY